MGYFLLYYSQDSQWSNNSQPRFSYSSESMIHFFLYESMASLTNEQRYTLHHTHFHNDSNKINKSKYSMQNITYAREYPTHVLFCYNQKRKTRRTSLNDLSTLYKKGLQVFLNFVEGPTLFIEN